MKNINFKIGFIFIIFFASFFISGCLSTQNVSEAEKQEPEKTSQEKINPIDIDGIKNIDDIEKIIIRLDGAGASREELNLARQKISSLKVPASSKGLFAAWSGRLFLLEGKVADAKQELQNAQNQKQENLPSLILSSRLEQDPRKRLLLIDQNIYNLGQKGELLAERGRILFDLNSFEESVKAFDAAFTALEAKPFYKEAYGLFRDKAYEIISFKEVTPSDRVKASYTGEITWKDLIDITKNQTDYLKFISGERDLPAEILFARLLERSFIPIIQDTNQMYWPMTNPLPDEIVLRSGAAWFLWYLHTENQGNRGLLTFYSSRYANTQNAKSPISDIGLYSPFFDCVLGCVEFGFVTLPDGRNFLPSEKVKGSDYFDMLMKLPK